MKMKQTQTLLSPFDPRGQRCVDGRGDSGELRLRRALRAFLSARTRP
jgi:hypothetical protein